MNRLLWFTRTLIKQKALAVALFMSIMASLPAWAQPDYFFSYTTGSTTDTVGANTLVGTNNDDAAASANIGFDFYFNGTKYTQFSASSNGLAALGSSTVTTAWTNNITSATYPALVPFWDDLYTSNVSVSPSNAAGVFYKLSGTAPNRILTVIWRVRSLGNGSSNYQFQLRLYETTNIIEYFYSVMDPAGSSTTATIALASSSSSRIAITPGSSGNSPTWSTSTNDNVNISSTPLVGGTVYRFTPCVRELTVTGDTEQGGTAKMADGDDLFTNIGVKRGSSVGFQPIKIAIDGEACETVNYTFNIAGTHVSNYSVSPGNGSLGSNSSISPTVTFTPSDTGVRSAVLTVTTNQGFKHSYNLKATGITRIDWIGNIAEGGTADMKDGDTLMSNVRVDRLFSEGFQPITVYNNNLDPKAPSLGVMYELMDPSGQYSIDMTNDVLDGGEASMPTITFTPTGVGFQHATLTAITTDGERRTFPLKAYSVAAGGDLIVNGMTLGPKSPGVFANVYTCTGEGVQTVAVNVVNTGEGDFKIFGVQMFETDTAYGQGVPKYPLRRDMWGSPVPTNDYFFTMAPGNAPRPNNPAMQFPVSVPQHQSRTIYLNFVPQIPGKRYVRAYVLTNGALYNEADTDGEVTDGLMTFDLFGRGWGAQLAQDMKGTRPETVKFHATDVGTTTTETVTLYNSGACTLRISRKFLSIFAGDVEDPSEFDITSLFPNLQIDPVTDDYLIPPGDSTTVTFSFTPSRSGSRRATLRLVTNDSTIHTPGISERGSFYWDLIGSGNVGLEVADLILDPAVIDGAPSKGIFRLRNTSRESVTITNALVSDPNNEFAAGAGWPAWPKTLRPGEELTLEVVLTPASGSSPGIRQGTIVLTLGNGQTVSSSVEGEAGIHALAVLPPSLFEGTMLNVGEIARKTALITNLGTLPILITDITLTQDNPGDYRLGKFPRRTLYPGQTEYLEVTYQPTVAGQSNGTITIKTDAAAPNDMATVQLGGTAQSFGFDPGSNGSSTRIDDQSKENFDRGAVRGGAELSLYQSIPNPGRETVTIGYSLPVEGMVDLRLYDGKGSEVLVLASGARSAGEHQEKIDVQTLPAGLYHYRLTVDGRTLTRSMTIVK